MKKSTLFLKRTILPISLSFWLLFFFTSLASFAQSEKTSVLAEQSNSKNLSYNSTINNHYTTFDEEDCGHETPSNDFENGLGNLHLLEFANDFQVNAGEVFAVDSISFTIFVNPGQTVDAADLHFYEDSGSGPGEEITAASVTGMTPASDESIGEAFDFDARRVTFEFEDPISFTGSSSAVTYWVGILLDDYSGDNSYIEVTTILNTDNTIYLFDTDLDEWVSSVENPTFDEAYNGVMGIYGECSELDSCTGIPDAGEIAGDDSIDVCEGGGFTLIVSGSTAAADLAYQWQSSPVGEDDWTDIEDANELTLQFENITEDTDFRLRVECTNSEEFAFTDSVTVNVTPAEECYCIPEGTNSGRYIDSFSTTEAIENVSNTSSGFSTGGYGDFTDMTISQENTQDVSFEVDIVGGTAGFRIWIDWNKDGTFSSDEVVYQSSGYNASHSGSFTVPEEVSAGETRMRIVSHWLSTSGDVDPCETDFSYGEFEDYTFEIIELEDCEGMPSAGTPDVDSMEVCAGIAFTVSVSDADGAANNLYRRWQSSPAGEDEWTDIDGSGASTFVIEDGVSEETDFRYAQTCDEEDTDISDIIEVTLKPATECYCTPLNTGSTSSYITQVETQGASGTDLNKSSEFSEDGYADYTETDTLLVFPGDEIDLTTTYQGGTSYVEVWIDWEKTGNFEGAEDHVISSGSYVSSPHTGSFQIPEDITDGLITRLRVRAQYLGGSPGSCEESGYGETEDYTLEVIALEDCEGPISAGTLEDDFEVCAGNPFTLLASGASDPAGGLLRQWESSPAGEDDWTAIEGAHSSNYNLSDGINEETDFRYTVTCENDDATDTSDILSVTLKPANECYCIPEGTNSSYYINNFSTSGGEENIENLNSGFSPGGYGDFTETHTVSQAHTLSVDFEADYEGSTFGTKIWVDWNQDGIFDEDEIVYQTSSYSSSESGSFDVPESAELGETRMRIGIAWSPSSGPNDPCESGSREFEDYTFEVLALEDCEGMPSAGTPVEDEIEVCALMPFTLSVSDATGAANNLYRRWQSSPAGEDDWTDMEGANSPTYTVADGVDEPTDFRYATTCNEEDTDISDIIEVTLKPALECYCIPDNTSGSSQHITNVTTEGALQDIDNNTGLSDNGYGDYSETHQIIVYPGQEFDYSITGSSSSMYYGIWIDMDLNGNFTGPDEKIAGSGSYISAPFTGSFEVPTDMEEGAYRLRVRANWLGGEIGPCEDTNYGETEDYTLLVIYPDCFPPINIEINYITDVSAQVTWDASEEDSWEVIYGEEGFDPEEEGTTIQVDGTPVADLTDLDDDTTYQVYIKTICDDEESLLIGPRTFTTNITPPENTRLCDAIPLEPNTGCIGGPYTNVAAFEETGEPIGSCLNDYRGENTVWFTFVASGDGEAVITTDFNSTEILTELVVFEAPTDCEDMSTLGEEVGCSNASEDGILELEGLTPGETYYVKVGGFNNTEGQFCVEVQLEEVPVCFAPTEITIGEISEDTVEVSWTAGGDETQWEVIYGEEGFNPDTEGDSEVVNTTEVTLTDLDPETDYEVYVRAICTSLNSDLAGPEEFTTEPMSVDNQVFANFTYYPNPVKDQLTLKAGTQIEKVDVYNLLGQNVISAKPNSLEAQINTAALQSGVYLMEVSINGSQKSFRVVKQ